MEHRTKQQHKSKTNNKKDGQNQKDHILYRRIPFATTLGRLPNSQPKMSAEPSEIKSAEPVSPFRNDILKGRVVLITGGATGKYSSIYIFIYTYIPYYYIYIYIIRLFPSSLFQTPAGIGFGMCQCFGKHGAKVGKLSPSISTPKPAKFHQIRLKSVKFG